MLARVLAKRGLSSAIPAKRSAVSERISLIGAPLAVGQPLQGVDLGPSAIRAAGLVKGLEGLGHTVRDLGDLPFAKVRDDAKADPNRAPDDKNAKNSYVVGECNRLLADAVAREASEDRFVLTVGGDHSIAIGSLAGVLRARPDTSILWVDAHADVNTPKQSSSKNLHGMVLAMHLRLCEAERMSGFSWMKDVPRLRRSQLVYVGLRDLDVFEQKYLRNSGITAYTMQDIDRHGIGKVMEMAFDTIDRRNRDGAVHLSVDIDSVDPFLAASTGTKVNGGLTYREANYICEAAYSHSRLGSMDLVEINPKLASKTSDTTIEVGKRMVMSALGQRIL